MSDYTKLRELARQGSAMYESAMDGNYPEIDDAMDMVQWLSEDMRQLIDRLEALEKVRAAAEKLTDSIGPVTEQEAFDDLSQALAAARSTK